MSADSIIEIIEVDPLTASQTQIARELVPNKAPVEIENRSEPSAPIASPTDTVYKLRGDAKGLIKSIRLPSRCWELLHRVDGKRDIQQLAEITGETENQVALDCQRLLFQGLLVEADAISLDEFRGKRSKRPAPPANVKPQAVPVTKAEAKEPKPTEHMSAKQTQQQLAGHPELLPALIRLVRDARGGGRRGELAVYLMFTRVPAELFRKAGLRSYLYVNESTQITDIELSTRLLREAEMLVGHALGDKLTKALGMSQSENA